MSAPARYATAPTPGAVHEAATVSRMARVLGTPLMPWQQQVARVVTERRADGQGWRYPVVVLTVPRQSGKTTLMRTVMAQRTLRYPRLQAFYTAQSGKDARERWADLADAVECTCPHLVKIRRGAGSECVEWLNGRGAVRTFAPTRTALHGTTPGLVMLDEVFAYDEELGSLLMGAINGAQAALRYERQIWIVSTAGDSESTWLKSWVDQGREAVGDPLSPLAFFEWSAPPELDLMDPASFPRFHPAVGHTQDAEALVANAKTMSAAAYERAFGNRWVVSRDAMVVPQALIDAAVNTDQAPPASPAEVVLAYDVAPDQSSATIWAAWRDPLDGAQLRPYMARPGVAWLRDTLTEATARFNGAVIAADDGGAARSVTDHLQRTPLAPVLRVLSAREFATATGDLIHALKSGTVEFDGDPALVRGLQGAALRRLGETDAWSRRASTGPIHAVIAATVAHYVLSHHDPTPKPMVMGL